MLSYFSEHLSALRECSICFAARRQSISALQTFDDHLRLAVSNCPMLSTQVSLTPNGYRPLYQSSTEVWGIRMVVSLALPAFLAFAASTLDLQTQILASFPCPSDSFLDLYLSSWYTSAGLRHGGKPLIWDVTVTVVSTLAKSLCRQSSNWCGVGSGNGSSAKG